MKITRNLTIDRVIGIDEELHKICRTKRFNNNFDLPTGYASPNITINIDDLKISNKQKYLLKYLDIVRIIGISGMEYDNFIFVASNGIRYKSYNC